MQKWREVFLLSLHWYHKAVLSTPLVTFPKHDHPLIKKHSRCWVSTCLQTSPCRTQQITWERHAQISVQLYRQPERDMLRERKTKTDTDTGKWRDLRTEAGTNRGFSTRMVYLYYITILLRNPWNTTVYDLFLSVLLGFVIIIKCPILWEVWPEHKTVCSEWQEAFRSYNHRWGTIVAQFTTTLLCRPVTLKKVSSFNFTFSKE